MHDDERIKTTRMIGGGYIAKRKQSKRRPLEFDDVGENRMSNKQSKLVQNNGAEKTQQLVLLSDPTKGTILRCVLLLEESTRSQHDDGFIYAGQKYLTGRFLLIIL
jgi:hypothetical protein